jgi:hypothetical protein
MKLFFKRTKDTFFTIHSISSTQVNLSPLSMATEYEIRISVGGNGENDKTGCTDSDCLLAFPIRTLEGPAFPPHGVQLRETDQGENLQLTWSPPESPSGTILSYAVKITSSCSSQPSLRCKEDCETQSESLTTTSNNYTFKVKPNRRVIASVAAVNSKGVGKKAEVVLSTKPKAQYPERVILKSGAKEIAVHIVPGCPYMGPFDYTVELRPGNNSAQPAILNVNESTDAKHVTLADLRPATEYTVCIRAPNLDKNCSAATTTPIAPESYPLLSLEADAEQHLVVNVSKTAGMHAFQNETLNYNLHVQGPMF